MPRVPGFQINTKLSFPIKDFVLHNAKPKCPTCGNPMQSVPGKLYSKCSSLTCKKVSRGNKLEIAYTVKITIDDQEITIFNEQLTDYCSRWGINITEEAMTEAFLSDEETTVVVNKNNVCICFL